MTLREFLVLADQFVIAGMSRDRWPATISTLPSPARRGTISGPRRTCPRMVRRRAGGGCLTVLTTSLPRRQARPGHGKGPR